MASLLGCAAGPSEGPVAWQATHVESFDHFGTQGRFAGLKILGVESLGVSCSCFNLTADAIGKKGLTQVSIHFEQLASKDVRLLAVDVDGKPLKAGERVLLARALAAAGKKAGEQAETVRAIAEALIKQELD